MGKLKLFDSIQDAILKLAEGNPGAVTVLIALAKQDPFGVVQCFKLDDMKIYGPRIWMLYKNVFRGDIQALYFTLSHNRLKKVIARKKCIDLRFAGEWEYYATKSQD